MSNSKKKNGVDSKKSKKTKKYKEKNGHLLTYKEIRKTWLKKKFYEKELLRLQYELVKMQYWIKETGFRLLVTFDGRDAAGKGGIIKRITEPLNPRGIRLVALPAPSDRERTQWYFQRYVSQLPAAGEIVIFDRSWYNRAGVERVMRFCTDEEYWDFLRSAPQFERLLISSGIKLVKYWLSVSDDEQERRFASRAQDATRRWKLSPMDLKSREKWVNYSKAKDIMFEHTDIPEARWYQIEGDDKRRARINCIKHLLDQIPYKDMTPELIDLPKRPEDETHYKRPPRDSHIVVQDYYEENNSKKHG
ncbi:MAG: polyphosphate kinase 2 [Candidatus Hodarchaeales archaeon]|jgi:polyphosphate kinase 2